MPIQNMSKPKNDDEYFELMTKSPFQAGLNWQVVDTKWPNFEKLFAGFSIPKVSKFGDRQISSLMTNDGIVRKRARNSTKRDIRNKQSETGYPLKNCWRIRHE